MSLSATQVTVVKSAIGRSMATTVAIETLTGEGGLGPIYATSANVTCDVDYKRQLIRTTDGRDIVSDFTIYAPATAEATFTAGSRVTIGSVTGTVAEAHPRAYAGRVTHIEAACNWR